MWMESRKNEDHPWMIYYRYRFVVPLSAYPLIHSSLCTLFSENFLSLNSQSLSDMFICWLVCSSHLTWMTLHIPGFFSSWLITFPMILQGPSMCLLVLQFPNFSVYILWVRNCLPDMCTISCWRLNLSLGIFADCGSWLLEGSSAGRLLGCLCLLINGVLRIQAKVWEWQILDLSWLHSFSGISRLPILLAAANVHCHQ